MNKKQLLSSCACLSLALICSPAFALPLPVPGPAPAQDEENSADNELTAHFGHIDAFYGDIDAFGGDIDPSYGHIDPFFGKIDPFWGKIDPFWGQIDPFDATAREGSSFGDISPFWGKIDPFWGKIDPFWGKIDPFWGKIDPFWGKIDPFWGKIDPFWGDISPFFGQIHPFYEANEEFYGEIEDSYGSLAQFWYEVGTFWREVGPMWGDIADYWGKIDAFTAGTPEYEELQRLLGDMDAMAELTWGEAIEASTGLSYREGFADDFYAEYGIDPEDPATLEGLSNLERSLFFLDFYDSLMDHTGFDHVDHWMGTINWTPAITQDLGGGSDAVIGLLDSSITYDEDLLDNISRSRGYDVTGNFHGAAVASLLVAAHDGQGVMGIAPDAEVTLYNPFDETGTTNWHDVEQGIKELAYRRADVINMSLGMPGWTLHEGWVDILGDYKVIGPSRDIVFVKAAGNDGITQTEDIRWDRATDLLDQLIVVGSVGPTEVISTFSNRPGEACITVGWHCNENEKLKYRFVVAPGELLLASDDQGGTVRVSGTSFAAPLVAGTVTLIQDRWPWLQDHPEFVSNLIFKTAKDLGEPGVDGTYGWGLLDVEAALSPLAFDNLQIFSGWEYISSSRLRDAILTPGTLEMWEDKGVVLSSFEYLNDGHRDFFIPLSSMVRGEEYGSWYSRSERAQSYIYQRLIDWAHGEAGFADTRSYTAPLDAGSNWTLSMTATPRSIAEDIHTGEVPFHSDLMLASEDGRTTLRLGTGPGAKMLNTSPAFAFGSDHDPMTGGVNPVFGFASGGGYAGVSMELSERAAFGLSFSRQTDEHEYQDIDTGQILPMEDGLSAYQADATSLAFDYQLSEGVSMNLGYTRLMEDTGLLGAQGGGALSLDGGAETKAMTLGFDVDLPRNLDLAVSVTHAHTDETRFDNSIFALTGGGADSSAWQVAGLKTGVFGKNDRLRLSLAQPLHVEDGALEMRTRQIIDRQTGEVGVVSDYVPLGGDNRPHVAEALYGTPMARGRADFSAFTRAQTNTRPVNAGIVEYSVGASFKIGF